MRKVVLTGGPGGGKSTAMRRIAAEVPQAYCAPEIATVLMSGGFPAPTVEHPWDYRWQWHFQTAVAAAQLALEAICELRAAKENKKVIVYDRGLLDGASYLNGGVRELEDMIQIHEAFMLDRYDMVLHLPSGAIRGTDGYHKTSNPIRIEEQTEAIQLENRVVKVWENHLDRHILQEEDTVAVVNKAVGMVAAYAATL